MTFLSTKLCTPAIRLREIAVPAGVIYRRALTEYGLHPYLNQFENLTLDRAARWVIALEGLRVVGVVGFRRRSCRNRHWHDAHGTWVRTSFRRTGLAQRLWLRALRGLPEGSGVSVVTCSRGGVRLALSLARRNAQFEWVIHEEQP